MQRTRLTTLEAKISKQAALESKVDFVESQTAQQLEEQARGRRLGAFLRRRSVFGTFRSCSRS